MRSHTTGKRRLTNLPQMTTTMKRHYIMKAISVLLLTITNNRIITVNGFITRSESLNFPLPRRTTSLQNRCKSSDESPELINRRNAVSKALTPFLLTSTIFTIKPKSSEAACLSGDTSKECIGYYKVPLDDAILPMIETPEALSEFAPGLRWVPPVQYPKNYKLAIEELTGLQERVRNLRGPILKGKFEDAGLDLLTIVPRITVAGRMIIRSLQFGSNDPTALGDLAMRAYNSETAHFELLANLGDIDVVIGQYINGQFTTLIVTQIEVLQQLKEADENFSDLMKAIPDLSEFKG